MTGTASAASNESNHPSAGLEKADTNYASWFDPRDVDATEDFKSDSDWRKTHKQSYWKYLDAQHRGYKNGDKRGNKYFQTFQSNRHLSQALADQLELTKSERVQAETWFQRIHFDKLGYDLRLSGFCVCLYLVWANELDERNAHPSSRHNWPCEFLDYYEKLPRKLKRCLFKAYGKVESTMDSWEWGGDESASEEMDKFEMYDTQFRFESGEGV